MNTNHNKTAISPTRSEDFPSWYINVVKAADLAEHSVVRGCMILKPNGYALWEAIQAVLDPKLKESGHQNVYFPLLVPISYLEKEAEHVNGFAKECAVVTHTKLVEEDGTLVPGGQLEEPYIIRPTSETLFGESMANWIQSYRDLPLKLNQWANVMRWEMRTRVFLRTSEFLWQEGHTAHSSSEEAVFEVHHILETYRELIEDYLAIPVIVGEKTPDERFPGAVETHTLEALMQDNKAVQSGTSHFLGQNFSKSANIVFQDSNSKEEFAWTTSWGVSTRLIGALIMSHADDNGLVIPPKIAQCHIKIIPVIPKNKDKENVLAYCESIKSSLGLIDFNGKKISTLIDNREIRWGEKKWDAIKKGIPLILEVGPKDLEANTISLIRRHTLETLKGASLNDFLNDAAAELANMQISLYESAKERTTKESIETNSLEEFQKHFEIDKGGFAFAPWCEEAIDHPILEKLKVTPRCKISKEISTQKKCIFTDNEATAIVAFAKSY